MYLSNHIQILLETTPIMVHLLIPTIVVTILVGALPGVLMLFVLA